MVQNGGPKWRGKEELPGQQVRTGVVACFEDGAQDQESPVHVQIARTDEATKSLLC